MATMNFFASHLFLIGDLRKKRFWHRVRTDRICLQFSRGLIDKKNLQPITNLSLIHDYSSEQSDRFGNVGRIRRIKYFIFGPQI